MVDSSREARFAEFRKQCGAQPGDPMDDFVRQIFDAAWQASRSAAIEECDQALITAGELQARWALRTLKGEG